MNLPRGKTPPAPGVRPPGAQRCPPTLHPRQARRAAGEARLGLPSGPLAPRTDAARHSDPPRDPRRARLRAPQSGRGVSVPPRPSRPRPPLSPHAPRSLPLGRRRLLHGGWGQKEVPGGRQRSERAKSRGTGRPNPGNHRRKLQELQPTSP